MSDIYTQEQLDFISKNRTLPRSVLATLFNKKFGSNKTAEAINSLCKRKGWFTGRIGQFQKGSKPWNTGTKGIVQKKKTSFKKGHTPANHRPVGSERIDSKDGYVLIKVAEPNTWKHKHVVIWESHYGKVEKGYIIRLKDNNPLNYSLDNLEKVSKKVHFRLNKCNYAEMPAELKPAVKVIAEIEVKIFEAQRR